MKKSNIILAVLILSMISLIFSGCGGGGTTPTINHSPTITSLTASPQSPIEIDQSTVITCSSSDSDGDPLTYAWTKTGGTITGTGSAITWTAPDIEGTYVITCAVSDGRGGEDSKTLNIVVSEPEPTPPLNLTISVDSEYYDNITGKMFVKGGINEITITFSSTVNTSVVKVGSELVSVSSDDSLVWVGSYNFTDVCGAVLITVEIEGVEDIVAAKAVIVDSGNPYTELKATFNEDYCNVGYSLTISSDYYNLGYIPGCCGDDCSGLAQWNIEIYDETPWGDYCAEEFYTEPIAQIEGTTCPITITTQCIDEIYIQSEGWVDFFDKNYWVVATLTDNVGNEITYYGLVETDGYDDEIAGFVELSINPSSLYCWCFAEDPVLADLVVGDCDGTVADICWQ